MLPTEILLDAEAPILYLILRDAGAASILRSVDFNWLLEVQQLTLSQAGLWINAILCVSLMWSEQGGRFLCFMNSFNKDSLNTCYMTDPGLRTEDAHEV